MPCSKASTPTATLSSIQQSGTTSNVASQSTLFLGTPDLGPRLLLAGDPTGGNQDFAHFFDPTNGTAIYGDRDA